MVGLTSILPVELRAHTAFSFNDGAVAPEALVVRAASLGYDAIGITDTSDLGGVVRAKLEADRQGIRLIVGAELVVDGAPLALIARDAEGCRNLAALITESRVGLLHEWPAPSKEAAYEMTHRPRRARGTPRLAWAQVAARASGLHLLTGPASGHVAACRQLRPHVARNQRRMSAAAVRSTSVFCSVISTAIPIRWGAASPG